MALKIVKKCGIVFVVTAFLMSTIFLTGCSSDPYAAKVNGTEIKESKITKTIENVRNNYGMTDDDKWGKWLAQLSLTPSSYRDKILDNLIEQEIVRQYAGDEGCGATDDEINDQVNKIKAKYKDDNAWKEALTTAGFESENDYREQLKLAIQQKKLTEKLANEQTIDDETLLKDVQTKADKIDGGKKSSHILFSADDEQKAQEVLDKINSGELDFAEAANEYSTDSGSASDGGNVGWDKESKFVDAYQTALDGLSEGEVSGLVKSDYGIHIIKCTEVFNMPSDTSSLDNFPSDLVEEVRKSDQESKATTAYNDWVQQKKVSASIERKEMPSNASYNVDMSKYESSSNSSSSNSDSSADSSSDQSGDTSSDNSSEQSSDSNSQSSGSNSQG